MRMIPRQGLPEKGVTHSDPTLWRKENAEPPRFPKRTHLSERIIAYAEPVIDAYLEALAAGHDEVTATVIAERVRPKMEVV